MIVIHQNDFIKLEHQHYVLNSTLQEIKYVC